MRRGRGRPPTTSAAGRGPGAPSRRSLDACEESIREADVAYRIALAREAPTALTQLTALRHRLRMELAGLEDAAAPPRPVPTPTEAAAAIARVVGTLDAAGLDVVEGAVAERRRTM